MSASVTVGEFVTRFEAELARAALSDAGIRSRLVIENEAGSLPQIAFRSGSIRVEVLEEDHEEAALVLKLEDGSQA